MNKSPANIYRTLLPWLERPHITVTLRVMASTTGVLFSLVLLMDDEGDRLKRTVLAACTFLLLVYLHFPARRRSRNQPVQRNEAITNDPRTKSERGEAGFTLIELLASTLLLIIGMLFFAALFGSTMAAYVETERTRVGKTYAEIGMGDITARIRARSSGPSNLALNKYATQSGTRNQAPPPTADKAVDGNTDGNYDNGSVSITNWQRNPWWEVDLGASQQIYNINVWNRTDCCTGFLKYFYVFVSNTEFDLDTIDPYQISMEPGVSTYYIPREAGRPTTIPVNHTGRYVRISPDTHYITYLNIAEVEVMGIDLGAATRLAVPDGGTITPGDPCAAPYCDRVWQPARQGATLPPPIALPPTQPGPAGAQLLFIRRYIVSTVDTTTNLREVTMTLAGTTTDHPFLTRTTRVLANK